jgi:hypothetical protein
MGAKAMVVSIRAKIEDEISQYCACSGVEISSAIGFEVEGFEVEGFEVEGFEVEGSEPSSLFVASHF